MYELVNNVHWYFGNAYDRYLFATFVHKTIINIYKWVHKEVIKSIIKYLIVRLL